MWIQILFGVVFLAAINADQVHNAVETEMFAIPISPNLFNWTYQEYDQQYRFHASLTGKPELPSWLRYIYSRRHHSGFIFGTPPRGTKSPITLEIIGLNNQDFETRRVRLTLQVAPKEIMARHEVEFKIDNLNTEDLLDEHKMTRLMDILRTKLWVESNRDLYPTFLASAIDLGARLPLKPSDGEGLVVRLGSAMPFSEELKRLREEVRPLSRLPSCPREYKRTTVERLFRDAGFTLDWCRFELYNVVYKERTTELLEYLTEIPNSSKQKKGVKALDSRDVWTAPNRHTLPTRSYAKQMTMTVAVPLVLFLMCVSALSVVVCFNYAAMAPRQGKVELCRYGTGNTEQTQVADTTSNKSTGISPNNSLVRPYSPKSSTNLAGSYNRPQPPPYIGSTTNSLHHRKSTADKTPSTSGHTPEHRHVLEESIKLLNEAKINDYEYKDPIVDHADGLDDYVPLKPDDIRMKPDDMRMKPDDIRMKPDDMRMKPGDMRMKPNDIGMERDLDDINVPELSEYAVIGSI